MRSKNNIARQSSSPLTSNIVFIAHQSKSCVINDIKRSVIILVARAGTNFQHLVPEKKWNCRLRTMREGRNTNSLPDQWVVGLPTPTRAVCASRIWPIRWGKGLPISNIFFPGIFFFTVTVVWRTFAKFAKIWRDIYLNKKNSGSTKHISKYRN